MADRVVAVCDWQVGPMEVLVLSRSSSA